jgi:6-phosphofructokinase 1
MAIEGEKLKSAPRKLRLGVLTGGGDVPGLNPCIKTLVNRAEANGWEVLELCRGWAGLLNTNLDLPAGEETDWVEPLSARTVRTIDRSGGTYLHTSRTNPGKVRRADLPAFLAASTRVSAGEPTVGCTPHVLKAIEHLGIDVLVPIGGDDTLSYAVRMHREGVPVVTIGEVPDRIACRVGNDLVLYLGCNA